MTPVPCVHCGGPVVDTEVGTTHVDDYGRLAGWLCPLPRMTLATTPDAVHLPAPPVPAIEPSWVAAAMVPMSRHSLQADLPDVPT